MLRLSFSSSFPTLDSRKLWSGTIILMRRRANSLPDISQCRWPSKLASIFQYLQCLAKQSYNWDSSCTDIGLELLWVGPHWTQGLKIPSFLLTAPSPCPPESFFCGTGIENIHDQKILLHESPPTPQCKSFKLGTNFGLYSPTRLLPGETRGTNYDWIGLIPKSRPGLNLRMFVSGFGNVRPAQSPISGENKKYSAVSEQWRANCIHYDLQHNFD